MNKLDLIRYIEMLFDELHYIYADGCGIKGYQRKLDELEYKLIDALLNDIQEYIIKMLQAKIPEEELQPWKEHCDEVIRETMLEMEREDGE